MSTFLLPSTGIFGVRPPAASPISPSPPGIRRAKTPLLLVIKEPQKIDISKFFSTALKRQTKGPTTAVHEYAIEFHVAHKLKTMSEHEKDRSNEEQKKTGKNGAHLEITTMSDQYPAREIQRVYCTPPKVDGESEG